MMKNFISLLLFILSTGALALPEGISLTGGETEEIGNEIILKGYDVRHPPVIELAEKSRILSCTWKGIKCSGRKISLIIGKAPANENNSTLKLKWSFQDKTHTLNVRLPDSFPWMKQDGKSKLENPLIFSVSALTDLKFNHCHLFVLSPAGEVNFYRSLDQQCHDFRPHSIGGKNFYSYAEVNETINYVGYVGPRVILDDQFHEIKKIAPQNDMHDFILLAPDHWIGFEFELARLSNGKPYLNKRLREWKEGKLILDWGASDIISQFQTEAASNIIQTDYRGEVVAELYHMNSIQLLKDGSLFVGLGHDGAGLLDRKTKKLRWVLGGLHDSFRLSMPEQPLFNHTPVYHEDTGVIELFSNRSWGVIGTSPARILKYKIDLSQKKLLDYKVLRVRDEFVYVMGSLQIVKGISSIGFGSKNIGHVDFLEMSEDRKENWKITFEKVRTIYRFYRVPYGE